MNFRGFIEYACQLEIKLIVEKFIDKERLANTASAVNDDEFRLLGIENFLQAFNLILPTDDVFFDIGILFFLQKYIIFHESGLFPGKKVRKRPS